MMTGELSKRDENEILEGSIGLIGEEIESEEGKPIKTLADAQKRFSKVLAIVNECTNKNVEARPTAAGVMEKAKSALTQLQKG